MMDNNKEKIENVDLILKQTWLAVSKLYTELAQEHDSTAVQALTLLKIDPKDAKLRDIVSRCEIARVSGLLFLIQQFASF